MDRLIMFIATGAGSGYLPKAPGTWGTLLALPIHFAALKLGIGNQGYAALLGTVFIIAVITAGGAEKIMDFKDPGIVVIDEIIGMLIGLFGIPADIFLYAAGFFIFRAFDIFKPFPISWFDRNINGGLGIVMDDVVAGLFTLACMQGLVFLLKGG